jgi:hypothetical protein
LAILIMMKLHIVAQLRYYSQNHKEPRFLVATAYVYFGFWTGSLYRIDSERAFTDVEVVELKERLALRYGELPIIWL